MKTERREVAATRASQGDGNNEAPIALRSTLSSMLQAEHVEAALLIERLTRNLPGDDRIGTWRRLYRELAAHAEAEQETVYEPLGGQPSLTGVVENAAAEHDDVRERLDELDALGPLDPMFPARLARLRQALEGHVKEEEGTLLPRAEDTFEGPALDAMATRFAARKQQLMDTLREGLTD